MLIGLIGPPCVGKGTQSRVLREKHGFKLIGAGDLLREASKNNEECKKIINSGALVPAQFIWELIEAAMEEKFKKNPNCKILLDGYPRELEQAQFLNVYLEKKGIILHLINMQLDQDILISRMNNRLHCAICGSTATQPKNGSQVLCCGQTMSKRPDDTMPIFMERLNIYNSNIESVRRFFDGKSTCAWLDLNANLDIDSLDKTISDFVEKGVSKSLV